jgi:outer membrane protein assembly factor BamB
MTRLGTAALTVLLLGAADAVVTFVLQARHGRHVTRWASDTVWSQALGDETWHLWAAHGGDGAPRLVVHGATSLAVWTLEGKRLANGVIPWGTDVAVADFTGDAQEEIAVAAEDVPPAAPVSIQVVDQSLDPVTPNVGLLESLENPASVAIVPYGGRHHVVAADFRGCLASLVDNDLAWEYCFPDSKVGGDPHAVRHLLPVAAGGGLLLAGRATGEVDGIDAGGKPAWTFRLGEPLQTLAVARLDGGAEIAFAGGDKGRYAVLDAATGTLRGSGTLPGMLMVARPATRAGRTVIAAAGLAEPSIRSHSGFVAVVDDQGKKLAVTPVDGQVMELAAADFDGDGSDELVAVTGAYRLLVLRRGGAVLIEETIASPSGTKLAVVPDAAGPRLAVGDGPNLQVRRMVRVDGPWWYAPRALGGVASGVLLLTLAALRPPDPQ